MSDRSSSPTQQVSEWLSRFGTALDRKDWSAATDLFGSECYWRDLISFTWNIKTLEGKDEIQAMLVAQFGQEVLDGAPARLPQNVADEEQFHPATVWKNPRDVEQRGNPALFWFGCSGVCDHRTRRSPATTSCGVRGLVRAFRRRLVAVARGGGVRQIHRSAELQIFVVRARCVTIVE